MHVLYQHYFVGVTMMTAPLGAALDIDLEVESSRDTPRTQHTIVCLASTVTVHGHVLRPLLGISWF